MSAWSFGRSIDMDNDPVNRRATDDTDTRILEKILGFERSTHEQVGMLANKISLIELNQKHMTEDVALLVSRLEFAPVKMLVYGTTGIILTAVVGALVALVVSK